MADESKLTDLTGEPPNHTQKSTMREVHDLRLNTITRTVNNDRVDEELLPILAGIAAGLFPERIVSLAQFNSVDEHDTTIATITIWQLVTVSIPPLTE